MKGDLCGKKYSPQSCKDEVRESAVDGQINALCLCHCRFSQNRQCFAVDSSKEYLPTQVAFHGSPAYNVKRAESREGPAGTGAHNEGVPLLRGQCRRYHPHSQGTSFTLYAGEPLSCDQVHYMCLSSEKGTRLPTKKGATEIFLSTSRESSKSSKKREPGVSAVLIEKEATRAC